MYATICNSSVLKLLSTNLILQGELIMNKNITKTILASTVIAVGLLITAQNQSANAFSYEWKGLEIAKKEADQAKRMMNALID